MAINETEEYIWDYSEHSDILNIHKKWVVVSGSSELGDFTVDFDRAGNIVGIEIMNVTDFLQEAGIGPEQLFQLQQAEMLLKPGKGGINYIWIKLIFADQVERRISIPAPVMMEAAT